MQCSVDKCTFFANAGCDGACSQHSVTKVIEILSDLKPLLPENLIDAIIWKWSGHRVSPLLTDDEIVERLGLDPLTVFIDSDVVSERILWLRRSHIFHWTTDAPQTALLAEEAGKLRKEDAERLMIAAAEGVCVRISFEREIVLRTFHRGALSTTMFPMGLCYHGQQACTPFMTNDELRCVVLGEGGGGGGGGGGGDGRA
jgi:hypothetical protein